MRSVDYHLLELEIALDAADKRHVLPILMPGDRVIIDIGCGIGQSLIALDPSNRLCFGLDIDMDALKFGLTTYGDRIAFVAGDAALLPFRDSVADLVFARVSLPYSNIPKAVREIARVLKPGGRIWVTPLPKSFAVSYLREAFRSANLRSIVYRLYSYLNGYLFKYSGIVLPFLNGRFESWQDEQSLRKCLEKAGFSVTVSAVGEHVVFEGVWNFASVAAKN